MLRWQLSSPILFLCVYFMNVWLGALLTTIIANLIGSLIFFWIDGWIFKKKTVGSCWQVEDNIVCSDCGETAKGYRLVQSEDYDKWEEKPEFRCSKCSELKSNKLKKSGVNFFKL